MLRQGDLVPLDNPEMTGTLMSQYSPILILMYRSSSCELTWQFGERRSHTLTESSTAPERNVSSTGDICSETTLRGIGHSNTINRVPFDRAPRARTLTFACAHGNIADICCHATNGIGSCLQSVPACRALVHSMAVCFFVLNRNGRTIFFC